MARNFSGTATTTETKLTVGGKQAVTVSIHNRSSDTDLRACVPAVHGLDDFDTIEPGETADYSDPNSGIDTMFVKTDSGTADYTVDVSIGSA